MLEQFEIIDISQPVNSSTAVFPGDVPFSKKITMSHKDSQVINLTAFTMTPHAGTHADAPNHIQGDLEADQNQCIGYADLSPYIGPTTVVDVSPCHEAITVEILQQALNNKPIPERILFKTRKNLRYDVFEEDYAWFSTELASYLKDNHVKLIGLDTPSVDPTDSKTLDTHHALLQAGLVWLENLDLTNAPGGEYFLCAQPLRFTELEASPVRAILLKSK